MDALSILRTVEGQGHAWHDLSTGTGAGAAPADGAGLVLLDGRTGVEAHPLLVVTSACLARPGADALAGELAELFDELVSDRGAPRRDGHTLARRLTALATALGTRTRERSLEIVRPVPDRRARTTQWAFDFDGIGRDRPHADPMVLAGFAHALDHALDRQPAPALTPGPDAAERLLPGYGDREDDARRTIGTGEPDLRLAASADAVRFFREAARQDPSAYLPDLATALHDHSLALDGAGRPHEAIGAAEDAVAIRQHLAKQDSTHVPHLANALHNLALRLAAVDRRGDSLAALEDVVAIRRHLVNEHPARYLPPLATALDDLAAGFDAAGQGHDRVVALEDAVAIRRHLARGLPERFLPDLAASLHALSLGLGASGRRHEALAAVEEAVAVRRGLAETDPGRHLPDLATSLQALSVGLGALGQQPESLAAGEEATQIYQFLAHHDPGPVHLDDLATSMENLAISLGAMGRRDEGRVASEHAVAVRRSTSTDLVLGHPPVPPAVLSPAAGGTGRCWCSCHTATRAPVDTTAITGPTPIVI